MNIEKTMEVELLNIMKYTTKDNRNRCILRFRIISDDCVSCNDLFKGVAIMESYFDGYDAFNKIPNNYFGSKVNLTLREQQSANNPLVYTLKVIKINDIDLV